MQIGCCLSKYKPARAEAYEVASDVIWHADRLLLQRIRKSQSGTTLYREASEEASEPPGPGGSHHGSSNVDLGAGASEGQRLLVVANRLPVSAQKMRTGAWDLQVDSHDSSVFCASRVVQPCLTTGRRGVRSLPEHDSGSVQA